MDTKKSAYSVVGWREEFYPGCITKGRYKTSLSNYSESGKLDEEFNYNSDGSLNCKYKYLYDVNGRQLEKVMYLADGGMYGKWTAVYNDKGLMVQNNWYCNDDNQVTDIYSYDDKERLIGISRGNVAQWTYIYDDKGKLQNIRGGYFSSDDLGDTHFSYDEDGRVIRETELGQDGEVRAVTTYEYIDGEQGRS